MRRRIGQIEGSGGGGGETDDVRDGLMLDIPFVGNDFQEKVTGLYLNYVSDSAGIHYDSGRGMMKLTPRSGVKNGLLKLDLSSVYSPSDFEHLQVLTTFGIIELDKVYTGNYYRFTMELNNKYYSRSGYNGPLRLTPTSTGIDASNVSLWAAGKNSSCKIRYAPYGNPQTVSNYLNGELKLTKTETVDRWMCGITSPTTLYIGKYDANGGTVSYYVKHLRVYNRALSEEEIVKLHNLLY